MKLINWLKNFFTHFSDPYVPSQAYRQGQKIGVIAAYFRKHK